MQRRAVWLSATALLAGCVATLCLEVGKASDPSTQRERPTAIAENAQSLIARGEYLVRAANCISCHTAPGGRPFAGGRAFRTPYAFLGRLYSSNITSDHEGGIGAWSEAEFIRAMRYGVAPGGRYLFPAFPYTAFTKLSTPDIQAIFAYLQTVAAVRTTSPDNSFWFRQRWAMAIWNWAFLNPGPLQANGAQNAQWNRGAYLIEAVGHCGACHRPRNLLLAEQARAPLNGGALIDEVEGGKSRRWSAPDLTSAPGGVATWSADDLRRYLKRGYSRRAGVFGPMNDVFANSLRYLTDDDIDAMVTYLEGANEDARRVLHLALSTAERTAGQALYDQLCEDCHLSTGHGAIRKGPAVKGSAIVQSRDPASLINVMLYGATPSTEVASTFDAYDDMPGFSAKLRDDEIAQLANFLRASWGNQGDRVTPRTIAAQR
jgi:mono/diheme cytochrome c family protein